MNAPFLRRVQLINYRSFRQCDVTLEPLTFCILSVNVRNLNFPNFLALVARLIDPCDFSGHVQTHILSRERSKPGSVASAAARRTSRTE